MAGDRLNVIALISGGKDSFFNILHCIENGHRVVALGNLFPARDGDLAQGTQAIDPTGQSLKSQSTSESDLNSFMYQTVGHEIIPLYAAALGLPLYRQPIMGSTVRHERDYAYDLNADKTDETESMTILLKTIMENHPEANAVCAGAILSTYQRTRVESVALRLGLTPLAYLWKFPILPTPTSQGDDAQLLKDMEATGLDARIIKVASAGLTEAHLWERVSSTAGADAVKLALRKFGSTGGAVLGEGGEYETLVVDGPSHLFKQRINVPSNGRKVVQEGGGSTFLMIQDACLEEKNSQAEVASVRTPNQLDDKFQLILHGLLDKSTPFQPASPGPQVSSLLGKAARETKSDYLLQWTVMSDTKDDSIENETAKLIQQIRNLLSSSSLRPEHISNTVVLLRKMADFPKVNAQYGQLFTTPNPPSRVTVACGELLPPDCNIAIYLTVDTSGGHREGLHVQSRSYWAPANIGPYSQAIGIPVSNQGGEMGLRSWSVAGQIPLVPRSMLLPEESDSDRQMQVALSLQHLWRIGVDVHIQLWTSAVALFARSSSEGEMGQNAMLADKAWRLAHGSPDDEDEEDGELEPWDLKYNSQHMSLAGDTKESKPKPLPDWSVLTLRQQNESESCVPPVFAVEVEELPRQAKVEWHAHIGLSNVSESSVEFLHASQFDVPGWQAWHTVARGDGGFFVHTTVTCDLDSMKTDSNAVQGEMESVCRDSLRKLNIEHDAEAPAHPYLMYVDAKLNPSTRLQGQALVPCHSIWLGAQTRLGSIALYRTFLGA